MHSTHGLVYVPRDEYRRAERQNRSKTVVDTIIRQVVSGDIRFPYKKYFTTDEEVRRWFLQLRQLKLSLDPRPYVVHGYYTPDAPLDFLSLPAPGSRDAPRSADPAAPPTVVQLSWFDGGYVRVPWLKDLHLQCAALTDYFTEPARMRSFRTDEGASPEALFRTERLAREVVKKAVRKFGDVSEYSLRHGMFGKIAGCNVFKSEACRVLFEAFAASSVLDISAGWGDRLIGALATPCVSRYLAFDPNTSLKAGHDAIISTLGAVDGAAAGGRYDVVYEPFETGPIPDGELFDLVFTSPPFFDLEVYQSTNADDHQSLTDHPTFDGWMTGFLFASMAKAWRHLKPGGHMAIYINDIKGKCICHRMLKFAADKLDGVTFVGVIGLAGEGARAKTRPCWVWRKAAVSDTNKSWLTLPIYRIRHGHRSAQSGRDAGGAASGAGAGAGAGAGVGSSGGGGGGGGSRRGGTHSPHRSRSRPTPGAGMRRLGATNGATVVAPIARDRAAHRIAAEGAIKPAVMVPRKRRRPT